MAFSPFYEPDEFVGYTWRHNEYTTIPLLDCLSVCFYLYIGMLTLTYSPVSFDLEVVIMVGLKCTGRRVPEKLG